MVKLIIQIPCWNEEKYLPKTLLDIPSEISGVDVIETLIIDDGSTDRTYEVAKENNVNHIIRFKKHKGLARGFSAGLELALDKGADIVVNFDADNAFRGDDIPRLIDPILSGQADIVIGDRKIETVAQYSWSKKVLQKFGSWVVRKLSQTDVRDAPCGFRAFSREAALNINVISKYSYTLETIIQAGQKNLEIKSIDITMNQKLRESRLIKNTSHYLGNSMLTIIRIFTLYHPLRVFSLIGAIVFSGGVILGLRYVYLQIIGTEKELFASLILTSVFLIMGFNFFVLGLLADLIGSNTYTVESILARMKKYEIYSKRNQLSENTDHSDLSDN